MKIRTFEQSMSGEEKFTEKELIPFVVPMAKPRNSGRKYTVKNRDVWSRDFLQLFTDNEFLAYQGKARTDDQIKKELLLRHKHNRMLIRRMKTFKITVGMFRIKYNKGILRSSQEPTFLMSFRYDENGYIILGGNHGIYRLHYMHFMDCYARCVAFQIADPRFIPYEYIVEIRNRQSQGIREWLDWVVPTDIQIKELSTKCKVKEIYNSVDFYQGYTREETTHDHIPVF
jgi:hypothetical protein